MSEEIGFSLVIVMTQMTNNDRIITKNPDSDFSDLILWLFSVVKF